LPQCVEIAHRDGRREEFYGHHVGVFYDIGEEDGIILDPVAAARNDLLNALYELFDDGGRSVAVQLQLKKGAALRLQRKLSRILSTICLLGTVT